MINNLNIKVLGISRAKFIIGIIIGSLFTFCLYAFAYIIREALRVLSVSDDYEMWVLSESEVSFYNLIYAFVAVIFGQSICFTFWLDKPRRDFGKFSRKIRIIVNDQRNLNWYFLNWFTKLAFVFGLMFGAPSFAGYYAISFYPDYNFLFVLVIIVLFLQSWATIRLVFKRNSFRWMLISLFVVSIVSFGMSKIEIVDYKALNENFLSRNIHHKYTLELPESSIYKRPQRKSLIEKMYVVYAKGDSINPKPKIVLPGNVEIDFEDLAIYIESWKGMRDRREVHHFNYIVHIDKGIKMEFINKLKKQFAQSGVSKMSYAVIPAERDYELGYYNFYYFPIKIHASFFDVNQFYAGMDTFDIKFNVKYDKDEAEVNDVTIGLDNLKEVFKDSLESNSNCIVKLYINDQDDFETYFKLISKFWEGAYELREEYSQSFYGKTFDKLEKEESRIVKRKYPIRLFDMTEERVGKFESIE